MRSVLVPVVVAWMFAGISAWGLAPGIHTVDSTGDVGQYTSLALVGLGLAAMIWRRRRPQRDAQMRTPATLAARIALLVMAACLVPLPASAASTTPLSVDVDVTGVVSLPTVNYRQMCLQVIGKDDDNASFSEEPWSQSYLTIQAGSVYPGGYSGPSSYLVVSFEANGLGQIGPYRPGRMTLMIDDSPLQVALPAFVMPEAGSVLSLYVANDGSTYYAHSTHLPTTGGGIVYEIYDRSVDLSPSEALVPEHLAAAIPEPGALALVGVGLAALVWRRRRK